VCDSDSVSVCVCVCVCVCMYVCVCVCVCVAVRKLFLCAGSDLPTRLGSDVWKRYRANPRLFLRVPLYGHGGDVAVVRRAVHAGRCSLSSDAFSLDSEQQFDDNPQLC